jgi:D-alanyl-D-alanine carboxypeptidase (penicillin-binding protein 5/6)
MPDYKARASGTQALLDYGFGSFERHKLYAAGQEITTARVLKGDPVNVELGLAEDLYVTIAQGQLPELGASTELPAQISAPLAAGVPVGSLQISLHGEILATAPLLTLNQVALGSLWLRIKDEFAVWRD